MLPLVLLIALELPSPFALAVSVSHSGLGQVLLFPYYTARLTNSGGSYATLITVTNTTADTKVARVRFRESRNGREVAGLNVYLGAYDSWTAAITAAESGGAVLMTNDQSCTDPALTFNAAKFAFTNINYSGANADGEDTSLTRTLEGYLEVFDLGVVKDASVITSVQSPPLGCIGALAATLDNTTNMGPPSGGLAGNANILSVLDGTLYPYDATALSAFSSVPLYSRPTASEPTLADVNPKISRVFADDVVSEGAWDVSKGASPTDPVTAILMADQLLNTFVLDVITNSFTDWVVTMPTKPSYVVVGQSTSGSARPPFESNFAAGGAPDYFGEFTCPTNANTPFIADREGRVYSSNTCIGVPPPPMPISLPWTANVMTFNHGNLLGAAVPADFPSVFQDGWAKISPYQYSTGLVHRLTSTDSPPKTYYGLPMIGFMANDYVNRTLLVGGQPVLSNYSATSAHKAILRIQ
jgi:hypothetical protein